EVPYYLAVNLIDRYHTDPTVKTLIDSCEIWIVPVLNPDGYWWTWEHDQYWRKNTRPVDVDTYGVDLNRNYGCHWGEDLDPKSIMDGSADPAHDTYWGPSPFSENETRAIRDLILDTNRTFKAVVSYHSYGQLILYPWGHTYEPAPDSNVMSQLAEEMSDHIFSVHGKKYTPKQSSQLYLTSGDLTDWVYETLGIPSFTIELRPKWASPWMTGFELPENEILPTCQENWAAAMHLINWTIWHTCPKASFINEPTEPYAHQKVIFNASGSCDLDGTIKRYEWNFGDENITITLDPTIKHVYRTTGIYKATLTIKDNDGFVSSTSSFINVKKLSSDISISVSPKRMAISDGTIITGIIFPSRPESTVTISYKSDGTSTLWKNLVNVTTDMNSRYHYLWRPASPGTYDLKAIWPGDESTLPSESSVITLVCVKMNTSISILTSCTSSSVNYRVNISGALFDMNSNTLNNETVNLYYAIKGMEWISITSTTTDNNGHYYSIWTPPVTDYFTLKAQWTGNITHSGTNNTTNLSCLLFNNQFTFSVESNSTISDLAFNIEDWTFNFTASGSNGTTGYVKVTIAKELIKTDENIRVYFDKKQLNRYLITAQDKSWLLTFYYNHSTHQIMVDLNIYIIPEFHLPISIALFIPVSFLMIIITYRKREDNHIARTIDMKDVGAVVRHVFGADP
ncbi:MAG: M14 family zinc carboxypeptidase, partial [Candidatus Bathyarchaeota archaeon]